MSCDVDDTICAIATASGGAARGIIRVSGPDVLEIVGQFFQADGSQPLGRLRQATAVSGRITVGRTILSVSEATTSTDRIVRPTVDLRVPCDLFLWPTSRSYTRQPVAELHTIGSPPVLDALLAAVCRAGARLAEPGEFTLRAFLAGRLDLTQAEAVLGVIDAHSGDDLSAALAQLSGGLARPLHLLRENLLQLLAELEAGLDFVEEDIEFVSREHVLESINSAAGLLGEVAEQMASRSIAARAAQVALIGPPNVGKSSLFNALLARHGIPAEAAGQRTASPALVSPQRGTTRDYLTAIIDLGGVRCELVDTAGVDEANNTERSSPGADPRSLIDAAAQALSAERRNEAAIRVCCFEAADYSQRSAEHDPTCNIVALTKSDLVQRAEQCRADLPQDVPLIVTSSRTGEGLDELRAAIRQILMNESAAQHGQILAATAERCRESVRLAESALRRAIDVANAQSGDELLAAELRTALSELGKVVGAVYTDDLLDRIFSSFCIGK